MRSAPPGRFLTLANAEPERCVAAFAGDGTAQRALFPTHVAASRAVLHGCTVEDDVLIGMGAIVLNGAVISRGSLVAAGAVVLGDAVIPPNSLVAGVPAKVRRELTTDEFETTRNNARSYEERTPQHARITLSSPA